MMPAINPATGQNLGYIRETTVEEVQQAVQSAREAFPRWKQIPLQERLVLLKKLREFIVNNMDSIIDEICKGTGKAYMDALAAEVFSTVDIIKFYEKHAPGILGPSKVRTPFMLTGKRCYVEYKPMGVIAIISPWNYPFNLSVVPAVSALAAGNTVVIKPSEVTPSVGKMVGDIFRELAWPEGVVQVVHGGAEVGRDLVDARPDKVFFTGSVSTGKSIIAAAAKHLIPVELELGGKDPMIVFEDANLDRAVNAALWGSCTNCGQVCLSVERIYVQEPVYDEFLTKLVARAKVLLQGSGDNVDIGCMTFPQQVEVVRRHLDDAVSKGARILCGGQPPESNPMFFPPTIVVDVDHSMQIMKEETFGPVIALMKFTSPEEVIRLANDSDYGLGASVWSRDQAKARQVVSQLITGNAVINDVIVNFANPHLAFGGVKNSGMGRYHGKEGLRCFCHATSVVEDRGRKPSEPHWYPYSPRKYEYFKELIRSLYGHRTGLLRLVKSIVGLYRL